MTRMLVALGLCFFLTSLAPGGDSEEAAKIISKAFEVMGGKDQLIRAKAYSGAGRQPKGLTTFHSKWVMDEAGRVRWESFPNKEAKKPMQIIVHNGEEAWTDHGPGTPAEKITPENFRWFTLQDMPPIMFSLTLNDLLGAPEGLTLANLAEETVEGQPCVGVRLTRKGRPPVNVFFDKMSSLPVRLHTMAERIQAPVAIMLKEYKETEGVRRPTRYILQVPPGKDAVEYEVSEFKTLKNVDPGLFKKP